MEKFDRWERTIQRNFPPFALSTSVDAEWKGLSIGPVSWKRGREVAVKFEGEQCSFFMNPAEYYISNVAEEITGINPGFEKALDAYNVLIHDAVRVFPGTTKADLASLNDTHRLVYVLMLIGYDIAGDFRALIDTLPKIENLESYLATAIAETAVERERKAFAVAESTDAEVLDALVEEFGYLHQDYLGKPWTSEEYAKAFQTGATTGPESISIDTSSYDDYQNWLLMMFKKNLYMYEEGRNAMVRCIWAMKETCRILGEDPERLLYMRLSEVGDFASGTSPMIPDDLYAKRREAYGASFDGGTLIEVEGRAAVEKILQEEGLDLYWKETETGPITELKGRTAYKGYAKGKARVVFDQKDADLVEDGDILISPMTQVEFLSGIRKCGAIVTDEGGIVCHAAIVAREFGKPCVLATKNATKAFKNGDILEVDADRGIVRRIGII